MNNPHSDEDISWTDLTALKRTSLYLIARLERDRREQTTRAFTRDIRHSISDTDPDLERYTEALEELTEKGLLTYSDGKYLVTDAGQQLLHVEYTHIGSVLDPAIHDVGDSTPSCPNCGDPVTTLSMAGPGSVRAAPCGCQLPGPLDADPLTDRLWKALQLTEDADARYHIRQAMQLAFARSHRYTE